MTMFEPQKFIAGNVRDIPRSGIRDFFDIVQGMKDVISLGVGEPDFVTPWHIREAAIFALENKPAVEEERFKPKVPSSKQAPSAKLQNSRHPNRLPPTGRLVLGVWC